MPDHVRRAIDARLGEAAWQEMQRLERADGHAADDLDHAGGAVIARLDDFRPAPAPARRRRLPVVAAVVALLVGAVGAAALMVDRGSPEPVATSVAGPAPGVDTASTEPPVAPVPEAVEPAPAIAPEIAAILVGLPTTGLAPERLDAVLAGIETPATSAVIAGVACAWVGHWHDAVAEGNAAEADRAIGAFADLDRWTALGGPGLGGITRLVNDVAEVVVSAGRSPADADAVLASVRPRVCDA
jgi:hypothetical protein